MAVDVTGKDAEPDTLWVGIFAFGTAAEALLRAHKGEMIAVMGKMSRGTYTGKDGTEREQWTLIVDSIIAARTARPAGRKKPQATAVQPCRTPSTAGRAAQ